MKISWSTVSEHLIIEHFTSVRVHVHTLIATSMIRTLDYPNVFAQSQLVWIIEVTCINTHAIK